MSLSDVGLVAYPRTLSAPETAGWHQSTCWDHAPPPGRGYRLTAETSVVRLDVHVGDLSVLHYQSVSLAPIGAQNSGRVELDVEGASKTAVRVAEKADAAALVCV